MKIYGNFKKTCALNRTSNQKTPSFEPNSKVKPELQDKSLARWAYLSVLEKHKNVKGR